MILTAPHMLWLLLLVPLIVVAHVRHRTGLPSNRVAIAAAFRALAVTMIVLSLAGPIAQFQTARECEVAVIDVSGSIGDETLATVRQQLTERWNQEPSRGTERHLVLVDWRARLAEPQLLEREPKEWRTSPAEMTGSSLADALDLAASMVQEGARGRIVLFSDGLPSGSDVRSAALRLGIRGITLETHSVGQERAAEVVLVEAKLPATAGVGSTVPLHLTFDSSSAGPVSVTVEPLDPDQEPKQIALTLDRGRQERVVPLELSGHGLRQFTVRCSAADDGTNENNECVAATLVTPAYHAYVMEADPQHRTTEALRALLGSAAQVESVSTMLPPDQLDRADLLVLADLPAKEVPAELQKAICRQISAGLGLLVTGGRQSFGPGGYEGTALAEVIPVDFSQQMERRDPSVTLVIIIDTSGSMTGPRIALAKEVARLAVRRLQPHDKVGVVEFYGTKRWAARIQSAANGIDINRALNRLSAGGGTVILPAIEESYYALLNVQTRFRHVLIITDGGVETGPFQQIITKMAESGITASTIMVGPGQHSTFLSSLAHWGRGRFYAAPDRFHLPEVILKQPEQLLASPFREQPSRLEAPTIDYVLDDIDLAEAPALGGYVSVIARPEADIVLRSQNSEPVLVRWRHGRGFAAAWMSDLGGQWSSELAQWSGMAKLVSNLGRQLARPTDELKIDAVVRPGGIETRLTYVGRGTAIEATSPVNLNWTSPDGEKRVRILLPVQPGRWNEFLATAETGMHTFAAEIRGGIAAGAGATVLNPEREISAVGPNRVFMESLSRLAAGVGVSAGYPQRATAYLELWPWLVLTSIVLVLLQVLIRRMPIRNGSRTQIVGVVVATALCLATGARAQTAPATQEGDTVYEQSQSAAWQGDINLACKLLEANLKSDATGNTHAGLAQWLELQGDDDGAIEMLRRAISKQPNADTSTAWRVRLGILLLDTEHVEEGSRVLREASSVTESAAYRRFCADLEVLLGKGTGKRESQPPTTGNARELLIEALAARRAGHLDLAETLCQTASEKATSRQDERFALQQWVAVARQRNALDSLATRLLNEQAAGANRIHLLANLLRELNRVDDLIALVERAATVGGSNAESPDLAELQEQVVAAAMEAGKFDSAVQMLERLIARSPAALKWRIALARLHLLQGSSADARRPLMDAMPLATQPAELFDLADAARDLAIDDVALLAIERAAATTDDAAFQAGLWRARLAEKQGDVGRAVAELEKIVPLAEASNLRELAQAFEHFNQPARAIELVRVLLQHSPDEDAQLRLAWLLEQTQQFEAARDLWREIWEASPTPALANQAASRLLELAAKTGTIADLAISIEDKLGEGRATAPELSLLVDLYTQLGDDLSASEILFTFARRTGDEVGSLRQLARAYLRMGRLAQADTILQQLAARDPANELEHLQERTVLAVERQRPEDAIDAIERMSRLGGDSTTEEMSAGVYGLLGDHERAARSYERVLAAHPEQVELWLLWANAMRDGGQTDLAIRRLQLLVNQAEQDDLFLVAVDGLLNLDAGGTPLRVALRRILERIAADPRKVFLYDAAADVMDTLGQSERINPLMEQALVFAGEQRGLLLREMMERAKADGRKDLHIEYGALLVGLDYDVPPQVLIDLGETFLAQNRRTEADRAFARACSLGDYATVRQKVADAYDRALLPQPAQRITAQLLITDPDNVGLLYRHAGLLEQTGRFEDALNHYERALRLLVGRMPRFTATTSSSAPAEAAPRRTQRVAANIDETTQFLDPTVDSLVACARTDMLQDRVVLLLKSMMGDELDARQEVQEGRTLVQFPRLSRIAEGLRWVAISLHRPDVAEQMDRRLLAAFPGDATLPTRIAEQWIGWGLGDRAASLLLSTTSTSLPPIMTAQAIRASTAQFEAFLTAEKPNDVVFRLLVPILLMDGRADDVRRTVEVRKSSKAPFDLGTARTMLIAGVAMGDPLLVADRLVGYIEACRTTPDGDRLVAAITDGVRLGWNSLAPAQQQAALAALDELAGHYRPRSTRVDLLRLRLAPEAANPEQRRIILLEATRIAADDERAILSMLQWVRSEERLQVLEQAWTAAKPAQQLDLLLAVAGAWSWPVDQAVTDTFNRLLDAAPTVRLDKFTPYGSLTRSAWHRNYRQPVLGRIVADHLLSQLESDTAVRTAAACALATAGEDDLARSLARSAWASLVAARKLEPEHGRMIDDLVDCFPYAQAKAIIIEPASTRPVDDAGVIELFAQAKVEARGEQEQAAVEHFAHTLRRTPTNETVRRTVIEYLQQTGRLNQLTPLFEPFLADRSVMQSYEVGQIADAYRMMGRPADALRVFSYDSGTLSAIRTLELEAMLGRTERLELILRRFLTINRLERRFYAPLAARPLGSGGMMEYLARVQSDTRRSFSLFNLLAGIDAVMPEFESLWRTAPVDRRDVPGLVEAIGQTATFNSRSADRTRQLEEWATAGSLHARDMAMLTWLIVHADVQLPTAVAELVREKLSWADAAQVDALETRARLCVQSADRDAARAVLRWALAIDLAQGRNLLDGAAPLRRIDLYLSCVPQAEREAEARRITSAWIANPLEEPNDRLDAMVLRRMAGTGDDQLTRLSMSAALAWLTALPSQAYMPRLERACAQTYFEMGDTAKAMERVLRLLHLCRVAYGEMHPLDATQFLPPADRLTDATATVRSISNLILSAAKSGDFSPTHTTRSLVLLGQWCVSQKLQEPALACLTEAREAAGPIPCERWLWVIDLARQFDPAQAATMEQQLYEAGLLPTARSRKEQGSAPSP